MKRYSKQLKESEKVAKRRRAKTSRRWRSAAQASGMAERFPFGFAAMNDNILYHALAALSILRAFGLPPRSALPGPKPSSAPPRTNFLHKAVGKGLGPLEFCA